MADILDALHNQAKSYERMLRSFEEVQRTLDANPGSADVANLNRKTLESLRNALDTVRRRIRASEMR